MPTIPDPVYFSEVVQGSLVVAEAAETGLAQATLWLEPPPTGAKILAAGTLHLRYGISFAAPSPNGQFDALIPGLFVSERGAALVGREAWQFMAEKFQLYPRADLVGWRASGKPDQVFLRALDWGRPARTFAYADNISMSPLAEVSAAVWGQTDPATMPDLFLRYWQP
jgi:hypothetical protein